MGTYPLMSFEDSNVEMEDEKAVKQVTGPIAPYHKKYSPGEDQPNVEMDFDPPPDLRDSLNSITGGQNNCSEFNSFNNANVNP